MVLIFHCLWDDLIFDISHPSRMIDKSITIIEKFEFGLQKLILNSDLVTLHTVFTAGISSI